MKTIVGLGEALWDMLPQGKQIGGAPINFAYHAAQTGHDAYAISALGQDALGQEFANQLQQKGMKLIMPLTTYPTGTVKVTLDAQGIPQYDICQQVAWDYIPFTTEMEEIARRTTAVCFGSLAQRNTTSRNTIYRFLDTMPNTSETLKIFDVNLRQHYFSKAMIEESLKRCNVVKLNDDEQPLIATMLSLEGEEPTAQCQTLLTRYNLKMVIYTCGTRGSFVFSHKAYSFVETPRVEVVDTVGAGDSFTGSFAGSLLNGKSIHEAHLTAVRVAAHVCTQHGAMPEISHLYTL